LPELDCNPSPSRKRWTGGQVLVMHEAMINSCRSIFRRRWRALEHQNEVVILSFPSQGT
jgi:hypothetical protein